MGFQILLTYHKFGSGSFYDDPFPKIKPRSLSGGRILIYGSEYETSFINVYEINMLFNLFISYTL